MLGEVYARESWEQVNTIAKKAMRKSCVGGNSRSRSSKVRQRNGSLAETCSLSESSSTVCRDAPADEVGSVLMELVSSAQSRQWGNCLPGLPRRYAPHECPRRLVGSPVHVAPPHARAQLHVRGRPILPAPLSGRSCSLLEHGRRAKAYIREHRLPPQCESHLSETLVRCSEQAYFPA